MEANGFGAEKGFALPEEELALPKMLSPSMGGGAFGEVPWVMAFRFSVEDVLEASILVPLIALMLPIFFLQVLDRQAKTYSLRSWLANRSGRLPFNCNSSVIIRLQTLHFASGAEGGLA